MGLSDDDGVTGSFRAAVAKGVSAGDWRAFEGWCHRNCTYVSDATATDHVAPLPDDIVEAVLNLLDDPSFLGAQGASDVLFVIECEWGRVSPRPRARLVAALE